uniref:Ceramide synthase 1 n=1 Tax=Junco hyemalis TaxID=40217 RepID=A0A8C5INT9_JUNHY
MPESAWKLFFYSLSWSYGAYLLFCTEYPFFHDPPSVFYGEESTDTQNSLFYPFFTHFLSCSGCRKVPFPCHPCAISVPSPCHPRAISVPFLCHFCAISMGHRLCWLCPFPRATLTPLCPRPCRFWFRLYWFPLKVLYATCHSSLQAVPNIPFYFFFNALLLVLTLMNIYWFLYIVLFVAKVLLGQMQEVNDVREYDLEESRKPGTAEVPLSPAAATAWESTPGAPAQPSGGGSGGSVCLEKSPCRSWSGLRKGPAGPCWEIPPGLALW